MKVTDQANSAIDQSPLMVNARLIHARYCDLSAAELSRIRAGLAHVPGTEEQRAKLWEQYQRNEASLFICRDVAGEIAFFVFFQVLTRTVSSAREFFAGAAYSFAKRVRDLTELVFPQLENFAARLDCQSLTVRTSRPGLVAKLMRLGYTLQREGEGEWFVVKRLGPDLSIL